MKTVPRREYKKVITVIVECHYYIHAHVKLAGSTSQNRYPYSHCDELFFSETSELVHCFKRNPSLFLEELE